MSNIGDNTSENSDLQNDRGLHYGDGLFETIAVKSGIAEYLESHINRLSKGCKRLKLINIDFLYLKNQLEQKAKTIHKGVIKIIVTRGSGGRGYATPDNMSATILILEYPWPDYSDDLWNKGVSIKKCDIVLSTQPLLAGLKHLNRLENVMARMELENSDFQEGVLCDSEQNVIEATSSNIFIVKNDEIITPKLDNCGVSGVMREQIIEKLRITGSLVHVKDIQYKELLDADEIFLSNSVISIWPVARLNERIYSVFSVTKKIMSLLNN